MDWFGASASPTDATESSQASGSSSSSAISSSWWSGLVDTVKKQSESIIKVYKEELTEFGQTLQKDTKDAVKQVAHSITGILGLSQTDAKPARPKQPKISTGDRLEGRIRALQSDTATYCTDPEDANGFASWRGSFKLQERSKEVSSLLSSQDLLRELHSTLVPSKVSYNDFWERYFFKLERLKEQERKRTALLTRATQGSGEEEDEPLGWDDEAVEELQAEGGDKGLKEEQSQTAGSSAPREEVEAYLDTLGVTTPSSVNVALPPAATTTTAGASISATSSTSAFTAAPVTVETAQTSLPLSPKQSAPLSPKQSALSSPSTPSPASSELSGTVVEPAPTLESEPAILKQQPAFTSVRPSTPESTIVTSRPNAVTPSSSFASPSSVSSSTASMLSPSPAPFHIPDLADMLLSPSTPVTPSAPTHATPATVPRAKDPAFSVSSPLISFESEVLDSPAHSLPPSSSFSSSSSSSVASSSSKQAAPVKTNKLELETQEVKGKSDDDWDSWE